eukprot:gene9252-11367_t
MRILLAEDDRNIATHVVTKLEAEGYGVDTLANGPDVWEQGENGTYAAIILDLGLPGMDGLSILKRWRKAGLETPVLVLTARGSWMERVDGFDAGADDYVLKPYDLDELLARIRALLRRAAGRAEPVYEHKGVCINPATREATVQGVPVVLSAREWAVLEPLIARPGMVLSPQP